MKKKKFFINFYFIFSLLILILTFYKSEVQWSGNIRDYYHKYYFLSFIFFFISFVYFYLNQINKKYFNIIFTSLLLGIYSFEIYISFIFKDNILEKSIKIYEKQNSKKFDTRTNTEILNDLITKNKKTTLVVKPFEFETIYSFAGISKYQTIFCNENGYRVIYDSDRYGFNNPDYEWDSSNIEYVLIGDSFVHGSCVDRPNDISSVLRNYSRKSVINLGFQGSGPLIELGILKEYFPSNAKKILWFYYEGNDLVDLNRELQSKLLLKYLNNDNFSQNLNLKQKVIDKKLAKLIDHKKNEKKISNSKIFLNKFKKILKLNSVREIILPKHEPGENFIKIMKNLKKFASANNSELYFVYLPEYSRYKYDLKNTSYNQIKLIVQNLDIKFIDIHKEVFIKKDNPLSLFPFGLPGHYNVQGYKEVSKKIYELTK
tara:strand:- start:208 stop:1497 length:1290 start_codon:yes stop_codon:yes gene_type:complete